MAVATLDFEIGPVDGWTLVATNPVGLTIKPSIFHPWYVAITASGAPSDDLFGVKMGSDSQNRHESFEARGITGEVYVRLRNEPSSYDGRKMRFGVIRDQ